MFLVKLEGPVRLVFEMELLSVSLIGGSSQFLLVDDEVKGFSFWKLGELSPPLLGARSLQSSHDQNATYQEVKELSATTRLSSFSSTNLPEGDSLLVVEHEMGNLPLHFEGWAEDDVSLAEGWSELFHQLKRQKGIVRISFPYLEQGGFLPTEG